MKTTAIIIWIYGSLILIGGVMGWVKARRKPSLIAGVVFGAGLLACGVAAWQNAPWGLRTGEVLGLVMLVLMGLRFLKTRKFMPAGLIAALSLVAVVVLALL